MSKPLAASSAILVRDARYLLVRRKNPPSADMYAFPGGRGEPGETPAETALREMAEETGIAARNPQLFATYDLPPRAADGAGARHFHLSVFLVEADPDCVAQAADDAAALGWYDIEAIRTLPMPDSVRECIGRLEAERIGQGTATNPLPIGRN